MSVTDLDELDLGRQLKADFSRVLASLDKPMPRYRVHLRFAHPNGAHDELSDTVPAHTSEQAKQAVRDLHADTLEGCTVYYSSAFMLRPTPQEPDHV